MYIASWYLKYSKVYRCVMLKHVAFLILGGYWKWAVSFLLHPHLLYDGGRATIHSNVAVGGLMELSTIVYMTVKIKIQAVLPETDNFYQKPLTSLWRVKNIASGPEVGFGKSKVQ